MFKSEDHTFVICAYGESPYLEECVCSLKGQSLLTNVIMVTSTPNEIIGEVAKKYSIPLAVNTGVGGIAGDWNFAVACAKTPLVTIAHQDDVYLTHYAEEAIHFINAANHPTLYFTDYGELRNGERVDSNNLLEIKRKILAPMKSKVLSSSRFIRRRCLSIGDPICCPSVTLIKPAIEEPLFQSNYGASLDWEAWESVANKKGRFVYNPSIRMLHRIHEGSETSRLIEDHEREHEDLDMFTHFWSKPIATLLSKAYKKSQASNEV